MLDARRSELYVAFFLIFISGFKIILKNYERSEIDGVFHMEN
jgi:hypothetical protein